MSGFRFASIPSNTSVATAVTLAVSAWFAVAAGTIIAGTTATDRAVARSAEGVQHAVVLMEEAAPASPTPIPVAQLTPLVQPAVCEKIVVEAQRIHVS